MLSLFPQILFIAPLAITLLRIVLALYLLFIAWHIVRHQDDLAQVRVPIFGHAHAWMLMASATAIGAIAVLLLVGAWTQVVAILALLVVLKHLFWYSRFAAVLPYPRSTYFLLACISLTLVVSGAGAFAFDLPL